jgi:hypothetical protein
MPERTTARKVLDREFLEIRCRLIDIAASLDRIDRADSAQQVAADPRLAQIRGGIEVLLRERAERAERVQAAFSDPYDPNWRTS